GSYAPPPGTNLTLVPHSWSSLKWTLRDATGTKRSYNSSGRLTGVTDPDGRSQSYSYSGDVLTRIEDQASGRGLNLSWSGSRVQAVTTDPPEPGQPGLQWTYSYTDGLLTEVCTPLSAGSCTSYDYEESSHYRAVVLDDNP